MGEPLSPADQLAALERLRLKVEAAMHAELHAASEANVHTWSSKMLLLEDELTALAVAADRARKEGSP